MPSKKPKIQSVLDPETHKKFQKICEMEHRSESQMAGIIIKKYISKHESEHGEIIIDPTTE